jgi:hypothetical protein
LIERLYSEYGKYTVPKNKKMYATSLNITSKNKIMAEDDAVWAGHILALTVAAFCSSSLVQLLTVFSKHILARLFPGYEAGLQNRRRHDMKVMDLLVRGALIKNRANPGNAGDST